MPYKPIAGTQIGVYTNPKRKDVLVACARCGRKREPNHSKRNKPTGLCRDCRFVMSAEEIAIWSSQSEQSTQIAS